MFRYSIEMYTVYSLVCTGNAGKCTVTKLPILKLFALTFNFKIQTAEKY